MLILEGDDGEVITTLMTTGDNTYLLEQYKTVIMDFYTSTRTGMGRGFFIEYAAGLFGVISATVIIIAVFPDLFLTLYPFGGCHSNPKSVVSSQPFANDLPRVYFANSPLQDSIRQAFQHRRVVS